jgi:hypothetical protein
MDIISYIQKINNDYLSTSKKDTELYNLKNQIEHDFVKTLDYEDSTLVNGVKQSLTVLTTKDNSVKKVVAKPNETISIGDIVDCYGFKWLVTSIDANTQIQTRGEMTLCPNLLKFQDNSGKIYEYPYFVDTSSASIDKNTFLNTPDGIRKIILRIDSITQQFTNDKRFLGAKFGGINQCWKIIDLNPELHSGLLTVTMTIDELTANDNVELGIADYIEEKPEPIFTKCDIVYIDLPEIKKGGSEKTFTAKFYNDDGTPNPTINAIWNLEVPIIFADKIVVTEQTTSYIKIKALFDTKMIGIFINLNLTGEGVTDSKNLQIKVVSNI